MLKMIFVWKSLHWKCLLILQQLEWGRGEGEASIQPSGRWAYAKLRQSPSTCNKNNYIHTWEGMRGRIEQDNKLNLCQKVNKLFLRSFQPFSKGCCPFCLVWGKWKVNCDVIRTPFAWLEVACVGGGIKIKINIRINRLTSERENFLTLWPQK